MANMHRTPEQGSVNGIEYTLVKADGYEFPGELNAGVLRDGCGQPVGFIAITRDITERKRAEQVVLESEERFRQMVEHGSDVITIAGNDGIIYYQSASTERVLGYRPEELIGKNALDFTHPDDVQNVANIFIQAMLEPGIPLCWELRSRHKDGSWRILESTGKLSGDDPAVATVVISSRDITERKWAEEELQRHTRSVEALHAVAAAVSQTLELDQMLDDVLERVLGVIKVDAGYVTLFDVEVGTGSIMAHQGLSEDFMHHLSQIGGEATEQEIRRWTENREPAFGLRQMYGGPRLSKALAAAEKEGLQSFVAVPLWSKTTLLGALVLASRSHRRFSTEDLELLKAIANQLAVGMENSQLFEKAQEQVEELRTAHEYFVQTEKRRALAEMAGGVAHDFNNFLAVILGRAQLALEDAKEPKVRKSLQVIEQSAEDAAKMVLRLRDSARAESHEEFEELDPQLLVITALQMVETRRAESQLSGVIIDITTDLGELLPVEGKPGELRQVLINIIFNAMDAMPHGGEITVKTRQEKDWAVICISDTGEGMTEDVKARIFDPFFSTKGAEGLGLGLSATYGIVANHRGNLEVDSAPVKGSTFTIKLPIAKSAQGKLLGTKGISGGHAHVRILLVDDEAEVVEVLESILDKLGHQVTAVNSGRAALEAMRSEEYDLLITDLHMPDISGHDVASAFRQARAGMPVLMITGWGLQVDRSELAADAVLAKPVSKEILSRQIAAVLR